MEKAAPVLWVQDLKNGDVGGGFMTSADTWTTKDVNYVARNTITGAGIKPDNTVLVTSGFQSGDVGKAAIINSPTTGTDNQLSKIVLPVGDYYFNFSHLNINNHDSMFRIFNVTDNVQEVSGAYPGGGYNSQLLDGYITVTGSAKEFRVDVTSATIHDSILAKGSNSFGASQLIPHLDLKIYKIG